jgi:SAM-dependent methyltransferase
MVPLTRKFTLSYSYRRQLLDEELKEAVEFMRGIVLDIGGIRNLERRGCFVPPEQGAVRRWIILNIDSEKHPDIIADASLLPIGTAKIDIVVCTEVLEYVQNPFEVLGEIWRVLTKGGILILSCPFMHRIDHPCDYLRFSEHWLQSVLNSYGFKIVKFSQQGQLLTVVANFLKQAVSRIRWRLLQWGVAFVLLPMLELVVFIEKKWKAKQENFWASFTTGYFVIAVKD